MDKIAEARRALEDFVSTHCINDAFGFLIEYGPTILQALREREGFAGGLIFEYEEAKKILTWIRRDLADERIADRLRETVMAYSLPAAPTDTGGQAT